MSIGNPILSELSALSPEAKDALRLAAKQTQTMPDTPAAPSPAPIQPPPANAPAPLPALKPHDVSLPPVTPKPAFPRGTIDGDQQERQRLIDTGSGVSQIKNPFLHGLAYAGNVLGHLAVPGLMTAIPGTAEHHTALIKQATGRVGEDQSEAQKTAQTEQEKAATAKDVEQTKMMPELAQLKHLDAQGKLAQHGLKLVEDGQGNTTIAPDENSPVYQQMKTKQDVADAQIDNMHAQRELREAQTAFENAKMNPNSPIFQQTQERLKTAQANAAAAGQRAQAYMGKYLQGAYNVGLHGEVLPGSPVIANEEGAQTVVGSTNASTAIKNQGNAARFNDVHGALDSVEEAARGLVKSGGKPNSPAVAAALAHPAGTLGKWLQGEGVKANLTPQERAYVQAIAAAQENIQALRSSVGGGVSDSQVNRLEALMPDASTPDLDYLLGQTKQVRSTADRLGKGATVSTGGLSIHGGKPTPPGNGSPTGHEAPKPDKKDSLGIL